MRAAVAILVLGVACGPAFDPIDTLDAPGVVVGGCWWPAISTESARCMGGPCLLDRCTFTADVEGLGEKELLRAVLTGRLCSPECGLPLVYHYYFDADGAAQYAGYDWL